MQKKQEKIIELVRGSDGTYREGASLRSGRPRTNITRKSSTVPVSLSSSVITNRLVEDLEEIGEAALTTLIQSFRFFR